MKRPERARPDINVTPLVDVVLVLLIIFMVVLPQMEAGANVAVPGVSNPDQKQDVKNKPITLSVTRSGSIFVEKLEVGDLDEMVALLRDGRAKAPGSRLILKGDRDAPYGLMRAVFRDAQSVGFPGISLQVGDLSTDEETEGES